MRIPKKLLKQPNHYPSDGKDTNIKTRRYHQNRPKEYQAYAHSNRKQLPLNAQILQDSSANARKLLAQVIAHIIAISRLLSNRLMRTIRNALARSSVHIYALDELSINIKRLVAHTATRVPEPARRRIRTNHARCRSWNLKRRSGRPLEQLAQPSRELLPKRNLLYRRRNLQNRSR